MRDVDALISGYKWGQTNLAFALPTLASQYTAYDATIDENSAFSPVTAALATGVRAVMAHVALYTGLSIAETSSVSSANLLLGRTEQTGAGHAYLPDGSAFGGDVWFSAASEYDAPVKGGHAYATVLHEIGHALGLKHGHTFIGGSGATEDDVGVIALPVSSARDSLEYTVMTYRSYANHNVDASDFYANEEFGYPQSLMMLDIAALQHMYGADFNANAGNTAYSFSPLTGEMSINGVGQGAAGANRLFLTIWDGGGTDTYDFSSYTTNLAVDLAPGSASLAAADQRANLGDGNFASGNVYNALQFRGDARSLIENATGGAGHDVLRGNIGTNALAGGTGRDVLFGLQGADSLSGGADNDHLIGDGPVTMDAAGGAVLRLYLATLNRGPDDAGWADWQARITGGQALKDVAAGFVGSAEFQGIYGSNVSDTQFVTLLYNNVLKRAPDAGGLKANVDALASGALSRTEVVVGLSESQEFRTVTSTEIHAGQIYRLYGATLARAPDSGGFETWTEARGNGRGLTDVAAGFVDSTEFKTTYGNLDDTKFVTLLYQNVLGRAPDAGGLASWTQQLRDKVQSRTEVVTGFSESSEYISTTRPATEGFMRNVMAAWSDTLAGGQGDDRLTGGRGADLFVFNAAEAGQDTVFGFESFDTLQLTGFGFTNASQAVAAMAQRGANVVLDHAQGSITFEGAQLATFQSMTGQGWLLA